MPHSTFEGFRCSAFERHAVQLESRETGEFGAVSNGHDAAEIRAPVLPSNVSPTAAHTPTTYYESTTTTTRLLHATNVPWTIPRLASRTLESPAIGGRRKIVTLDVARHVSVGVRQITTDRVSVGDKPGPFAIRFPSPVQVRARTVGRGCRGGHATVGARGRAVCGGVQVAG